MISDDIIILLAQQATISSRSTGPDADAGDAGNVRITTSGAFTSNASTITTSANNAKGGKIDITADAVELSNGTLISGNSQAPQLPDGEGNAGNVTVRSGSTFVMRDSAITTEASQASGGQITVTAPEMVRLVNSRISSSVAGSAADISGGDIIIDPQFVILQNSQILAQAIVGLAGNLSITANVFLIDPNSFVDASGQLRISTVVTTPVSGELAPLAHQFSSADVLLFTQRCAADPTGQFSTFVQTGRDGVPQVPGALSPSPLSFLETLTSSSLGSPSPNWAARRLGLDSVHVDDSTRFLSACRS